MAGWWLLSVGCLARWLAFLGLLAGCLVGGLAGRLAGRLSPLFANLLANVFMTFFAGGEKLPGALWFWLAGFLEDVAWHQPHTQRSERSVDSSYSDPFQIKQY